MKKVVLIFLVLMSVRGFAQKNPGDYMSVFSKESKQISEDMWSYTSAVAHGKSARKVANRRKELINTVADAKRKIASTKGWEGDNSLRDSLVSYMDLNHKVLTHDFGKIMDMEEVAEQSYDAMEAYLLAQQKANEKLDKAGDRLEETEKAFAKRHNVNLIESKDKLSQKLAAAGKVMSYYNKIYLIFFKAYKQELYMLDAMKKNDMNAVEQNRNALLSVSKAAIASIDTVKAYNGDVSVKSACKNMMTFYQNEASEKVPQLADFYLKKDNFEKIKAAFDAKPADSRKQEDVDSFNKAVNEYNAASNKFNAINQALDKERSVLINTWNETVSRFLDKNVAKK